MPRSAFWPAFCLAAVVASTLGAQEQRDPVNDSAQLVPGAHYRAGWLRSKGKSIFLEAAMAKLQISESLVLTAQDAIQVHGGYGYMEDYEIERELRDAIASRLYSGTSEVQRMIIASLVGV